MSNGESMPRRRFGSGRMLAVAVAAMGLALSGAAFWISRGLDTERVRNVLELRADWRSADSAYKLRGYIDSQHVIADFVATHESFGEVEFGSIARQAKKHGDAVRALGWVPRVRRDQVPEFLKTVREAGNLEFRILDRGPGGSMVAAADRDEYFPALYSEYFEGQPSVAGLTFETDPARRAAMDRARDEAKAVATHPTQLFASTLSEPAYLVFWPVYERGQTPATFELRRATLRGFVVGVYGIRTVLTEAIKDTPGIVETIGFFVGAALGAPPAEPTALYSPATRGIVVNPGGAARPHALRIVRAHEILGQVWRMEFDFGPEVVSSLRSTAPWGWLLAGLLLTAAVTFTFATQGARKRVVEALVAARTADLNRSNEQLRREVGQRAKNEVTIRDTSALLQAVIEESPFAIIGLDPQHNVIIWNRAAERIFGYVAAEVLGTPYPLVPAEGQGEFDEFMSRTAAGVHLRNVAVRRRRKDGKLADVVFSGAPLFAPGGALRAMIFVLEDVTERLAVERQLQQAQRMEVVGQLTGGIAHDFNNLLGIVVGNLDLAVERLAADPKTLELVEAALKSALRGADVVQRLLAFSRRQPLAPKPIDLDARLPELSALLRRTLGESIMISTVPGANLWPAVADATQVDSAILNLAINARDAMPKGGTLTVETANVHLDENYAALNPEVVPGDYVMIGVSDTGTGMQPEVVERAFEPFYTTKAVGKGSGLGLAMVHVSTPE